ATDAIRKFCDKAREIHVITNWISVIRTGKHFVDYGHGNTVGLLMQSGNAKPNSSLNCEFVKVSFSVEGGISLQAARQRTLQGEVMLGAHLARSWQSTSIKASLAA